MHNAKSKIKLLLPNWNQGVQARPCQNCQLRLSSPLCSFTLKSSCAGPPTRLGHGVPEVWQDKPFSPGQQVGLGYRQKDPAKRSECIGCSAKGDPTSLTFGSEHHNVAGRHRFRDNGSPLRNEDATRCGHVKTR
jgi:hypothetical protein